MRYGPFIAGMFLLWWGLLQGGREIAAWQSTQIDAWLSRVCLIFAAVKKGV
jgi:hypothetical protein